MTTPTTEPTPEDRLAAVRTRTVDAVSAISGLEYIATPESVDAVSSLRRLLNDILAIAQGDKPAPAQKWYCNQCDMRDGRHATGCPNAEGTTAEAGASDLNLEAAAAEHDRTEREEEEGVFHDLLQERDRLYAALCLDPLQHRNVQEWLYEGAEGDRADDAIIKITDAAGHPIATLNAGWLKRIDDLTTDEDGERVAPTWEPT